MKELDKKIQRIDNKIKLLDVVQVIVLSVIVGLTGLLLSYLYALN